MSNNYQLGKTRRIFPVIEPTYAAPDDPTATDFMRVIGYQTKADPTNKRTSKEKKRAPGYFDSFIGRVEANLDSLTHYVRPSGAPATLPEHHKLYLAAWGAFTNPALATVVVYGTGGVGGCKLHRVDGLARNVVISIECTDGFWRHRRLMTVNATTNIVTWYPNLPTVPADGANVKSVPTYSLTTGRGPSLGIFDYNITVDGDPAQKRLLDGILLDKFGVTMDANEELLVNYSGPARFRTTQDADGDLPDEPDDPVTVGDDVPMGMVGETYVGHELTDLLKSSFEFTNGYVLDNRQAGTRMAREGYRSGMRQAMLKINANVQVLNDLFLAGSTGDEIALAQQYGLVQGYGHSLFMPRCEAKEPNEDDPETETSWDHELKCKEETYDGNDEAVMGIG